MIPRCEQVAAFKWGTLLSKNFALSPRTASRYIRYAELVEEPGGIGAGAERGAVDGAMEGEQP